MTPAAKAQKEWIDMLWRDDGSEELGQNLASVTCIWQAFQESFTFDLRGSCFQPPSSAKAERKIILCVDSCSGINPSRQKAFGEDVSQSLRQLKFLQRQAGSRAIVMS